MNVLRGLIGKAIANNPTFVLTLGLCPTLAVTTSVKNGLAMGVATATVLLCSNILISMVKRLIPKEVRIACYIVIIAGFVTMVEILMQALMDPAITAALGIFIPLIVVNCIILGRAEAFASRNSVPASIGDAIGIGLGFTGALALIGLVREFVGSGTLWDYAVIAGFSGALDSFVSPLTIAIMAPGAFVVIGLLFGLFNAIGHRRERAKMMGAHPVTFQTAADLKKPVEKPDILGQGAVQ